jgi:hypothetical protein
MRLSHSGSEHTKYRDKPNSYMFGALSPPMTRATLPSELLPTSPYEAASGASPAPTPSNTMTIMRLIFSILFSNLDESLNNGEFHRKSLGDIIQCKPGKGDQNRVHW